VVDTSEGRMSMSSAKEKEIQRKRKSALEACFPFTSVSFFFFTDSCSSFSLLSL
jgi:hypothetical protein